MVERSSRFPRTWMPVLLACLLAVLSMVSTAESTVTLEAQVFKPRRPSPGLHSRLATAEQTQQQWRDKDPDRFLEVNADFDGDEFDDHASIWINESYKVRGVIVKITSDSAPPYEVKVLDVEVPFEELARTGIRLVKPGVYETACGKGERECREGEPKTIELTNPSISLFLRDGPEMFFFWDATAESYVGVDIRQ